MARKNTPVDVFRFINMMNGDITKCWPWKRKLNKKDGRPYFVVDGKERPAYVIVLELASGEDAGDRVARHKCDVEDCCNPSHLSWGTHQDNSDDMMERDRHGVPKTVLRAIRKLLGEGRTHRSIAELYGLSRETVTAINRGRSHKSKA